MVWDLHKLTVLVQPVAQVIYLNSSSSPGMPSFINGVPTLVLDYDREIDMVNDHEARNEYATQVKAYFDFVKGLINKKKE